MVWKRVSAFCNKQSVSRSVKEKNGGKKEQERVDAKAEEWVKAVAVMK